MLTETSLVWPSGLSSALCGGDMLRTLNPAPLFSQARDFGDGHIVRTLRPAGAAPEPEPPAPEPAKPLPPPKAPELPQVPMIVRIWSLEGHAHWRGMRTWWCGRGICTYQGHVHSEL